MLLIRRVDRESADSMETLGTKPKFWFREGDKRLLFKAEDRGTGEDWAEVVACGLCGLLGLPHVEYQLAEEYEAGRRVRPGVVCENMAPPPLTLVLGNQLLLERDPTYPRQQRYHVHQHTVQSVADIIANLQPPADLWMTQAPADAKTALDVFVGYMLLDAWIANQERHHENWAALRDDGMRLAPTYDHGASLARNILDDQRQEHLTTKDRNRTVSAFAARARSAFYNQPEDQRAMGLVEAFQAFAALAPIGAKAWLSRLADVTEQSVRNLLDEIPSLRMTDVAKQFTFELLGANRQRLLQGFQK